MDESEEYMLRWRGREFGPFSLAEVNRKLDQHELGMSHEIHFEEKWMTLEAFFSASKPAGPSLPTSPNKPQVGQPNLGRPFGHPPGEMPPLMSASLPPQPGAVLRPASPPMMGPAPIARPMEPEETAPAPPGRRLIYALLAVLLGFSGAHNYYARQWLTGLLQLLLSVATFLLGFGIIASWVWALMEAVFVRRDASGQEMA